MAKTAQTITETKNQRKTSQARRDRAELNAAQPAKPSTYAATLNALQALLNGTPIGSLRTSRLASLAKKAGLRKADLASFVSAHKLAANTNLSADVVFAVTRQTGGIDASKLAAADPVDLRKKIASAVEANFVSAETLVTFDAARPSLARVQTHEAPLRSLVKTYDLNVPDSVMRKLEAKKINTLADIRATGSTSELAKKLNLKPDDNHLTTVTAHANLSFLGSDVRTNSVLIRNGYTHLSQIANEPGGAFINTLRPIIGVNEALRIQSVAKAQNAPSNPRPSVFTAAVDAISPNLNGSLIASLSKSRITSLAKETGVKQSDLSAIVAAHKLAEKTNLPADVLFALGKNGVQPDVTSLASTDIRQIRKKVEVAVKKNLVPIETLTTFDRAKPSFARVQAVEAPLRTLVNTYKLKIPASFAGRLEAKGFKTLADLRSAGGTEALAKKLNLRPDDGRLTTITAHANLSFLGSDVRTNSVLIKNGYTHLAKIANEPDSVLVDKVSSVIGFAEAMRIQSVAKAQTAVLENHLLQLRTNQANGFALDSTSDKIAHRINNLHPQKCEECEDCEAAVSPLAYLADLISYATTKLGTAKANVVPLYRLWLPESARHFYTQEVAERDFAAARLNYQYERIACYILSSEVDGTLPLYWFVHEKFSTHFYATYVGVEPPDYKLRGSVGFIYKGSRGEGSVPLLRLWNEATGDYFYTIDTKEKPQGYIDEVTVGYVPKERYDRVTPHHLTDLFHQPFSELPLSCDEVNEAVRQVRICIEVLRSRLSGRRVPPRLSQDFNDKQTQYRRETYQALLLRLGTSYTELREARGATKESRQALADRLGIPLGRQQPKIPLGSNQRDYLNELLLDPDTATELDLERLFGLVDTNRDPLSRGAKLKDARLDAKNQLQRWNFSGASWGVNTDLDGIVYVSLSRSATDVKVEIYRDSKLSSSTLEASGQANQPVSTIALEENKENGLSNGLSGEVDVKFQINDKNIIIQVIPQIVSWRLQKIRSQWQDQDWIKDSYTTYVNPEERLPMIEPDLIGPDDFRDLAGKAFMKLWKPRRQWVDGLIGDLTKPAVGDAFEKLFEAMESTTYGATTNSFWPGDALKSLPTLQKELSDKSDKDKLKTLISDLWNTFRLNPEMLSRLLSLKNKYDSWVYDDEKNGPLEAIEWEEVYNLLAQAQKSHWYSEWVQEETGFVFGPKPFWISLREPKEGTWPPPALKNTPRIDPETVKLDDLADETTGQEAIDLWSARQDELKDYRQKLSLKDRDLAGATARLTTSLGVTIGALTQNYALVQSQTPTDIAKGTTYVQDTLKWSVEAFLSVMSLRAQLIAQIPPLPKPSDAEWSEMERLLTTAYKERVLWKKWADEEATLNLTYWEMVKAKLPRWRGSVESRQVWQRGLLARSAAPLIDPDLLRETHFRHRRENPALDLWRGRVTELTKAGGVFARFLGGSKTQAGLENRLDEGLGPFQAGRLPELLKDSGDGNVSAARLDQLSLDRSALDFLRRMHGLLGQNPAANITPDEWKDIAAILTQAWKRRQTAEWRLEEEQKGMTLSPDWFNIPSFGSTTQFPPPRPPDPPKWRGARSDVVDWEDRLQSRIDQQQAIIDGVKQVVSEVEEATLPMLRDALINVSNVPGTNLSEKADWITENLLIDAKQSGCHKTTRIAQAIETLQQLLWSVRTGLLADAHPDLQLLPIKGREDIAIQEFDEAWKWIGSYNTWRAAMFVFLYPENIAIPSLKGHQSPGLRQIVDDFRGLNRIIPNRFVAALKRYYEYFNDVCNLTLAACFDTLSNLFKESEDVNLYASPSARLVSFLFGLTENNALYWSILNRSDREWGQTYWRKLTGFKNEISSLLGCTVYKTPGNRRLLYLFGITNKDGEEKIEFLRLDLKTGKWDSETEEVKTLPEQTDQTSLSAALQSTNEDTIPTLFIIFPDSNRLRINLGKKGGSEESKAQQLGTTGNWTARTEVPTNFDTIRYDSNDKYFLSGISVCKGNINGTQKLFCYWVHCRPLGNDRTRVVMSDLQNKTISWTQEIGTTFPNEEVNTFWAGYHSMGFAICNLKGVAHLISAYLKPDGSEQRLHYQIGSNLSADGAPTSWSQEIKTEIKFLNPRLGGFDYDTDRKTHYALNGLRMTVATAGDRNFLVAFAASSIPPFTYELQVVELDQAGNLIDRPVMPVDAHPPTLGDNGVSTGIGVSFGDLSSSNELDVVIFYLMRPKSGYGNECLGEYFVGRNLNLDTFKPEGWSSSYYIGDKSAWFGGSTAGAAIAITDIDENGRADLVVFHMGYRGSTDPDQAKGFYRVGFDLGFEKIEQSDCTEKDIQPVSLPVQTDLYRLLPPKLNPPDFSATKYSRNRVYIEEACFFVPILAALQLQKGGEYIAALDTFRLVYDYISPRQQRSLIGLAPINANSKDFQRDDPSIVGDEYDWLLDPLNPHAIAKTRNGTYLRFTLLSIIKCLLDYADYEFTQDTMETVPRARELYMTALQLLYNDELKPVSETCEGVLQNLEITFGEEWADYTSTLVNADLTGKGIEEFKKLADGLIDIFERNRTSERFLTKARDYVAKFTAAPQPVRKLGSALDQLSIDSANWYAVAVAEKPMAELLDGMAERTNATPSFVAAYSQFPNGSRTSTMKRSRQPENNGDLNRRDETSASKNGANEGSFGQNGHSYMPEVGIATTLGHGSALFCVPRNPILRMLRLRANLNLYKIRTCRNISGLKRELELYAAPTDTQTGLPSIGAGGQLVLPGTVRIQPSPYRYQTLVDRAKQLVQLAMQVEQAFLSALEKSDAEAYALLKARQDLDLTEAGVTLQDLRVQEAQGGVKLATLQRDRATIQIKTYAKWMSAGLSQLEQAIIGQYIALGVVEATIGIASTTIEVAATKEAAAFISPFVTLAAARVAQAGLSASIKVSEVFASQERRMEEWQLQMALAQQDFAIGDQQIDLAEDHVRVTEQERTIAKMQAENAQEVVDFLSGKFTNKDLYDWMSGVLERVYSFFLQQATAVAQLAEGQLAFERQETPPNFIQADYWDGPPDNSSSSNQDAKAPDRRGLTGSARLLQDIYQLDQYAFDNDKRKLQLTKTVSLAQLDPFGFQQFRETGILNFATPMELFDRDFPGHYLRLTKRVRTSVIALIPPNQGIRATLSSTGLSRVVIGGDIFQKINLRRDPETVALSSPINATGLFDLETQTSSDMLLPFEGTGVDKQWEFRMLKASNQFDYNTIADLLFTIEYTALNSFDYQQQVIQSPALTRPLSADRPFSFRYQFADAWYDLHNPDQSATPMRVSFETRREDFPPNLSNPRIQHVVLYLASTTDTGIELQDIDLHFTEQGTGDAVGVGGPAGTNDGVISTRRGNANAWNLMIGKSAVGQWTIHLPKSAREFFNQTPINPQKPTPRVADILLAITYSGRTPEWPQ